MKELKRYGTFERSGFKDVLLGKVDNFETFCELLKRSSPFSLGRVVPINKEITNLSVENIREVLCTAVKEYATSISKGSSFAVRVKRRGALDFHQSELEKELGSCLWIVLEERGITPKVDLRDPDVLINVEFLGSRCYIGIITRSMRKKYPFVKPHH